MIPLDVVAMLLFFSFVGIHLFFKRRELKFSYGIVLEKWKSGLKWLDKVAKKHGKLIHYLEISSVIVGFLLSFAGFAFIFYSIFKSEQGIAFVLPSVAGIKYPGPVISIPFWYWLIVLFIVTFPHETAHALFAKKEKIKINSYGIVYLLLLPVSAFTEPNKKQLENAKWLSKIKIFSAGSFFNLIVAAVAFLLLFATMQFFYYLTKPVGISFTTIENTPAAKANLSGIILKINETNITSIYDLIAFLNNTRPGESVTVYTTKGVYNIRLAEKEGRSFIGITNVSTVYVYAHIFKGEVSENALKIFNYWRELLFWIFVVSVGVAAFNMLPAKPLDGSLFYEEILKLKLGKKKAKKISNIMSILTWTLILLSLSLFRTR